MVFVTDYIKRFISSTFIGCKVTKIPSNNSHVIHKKVHFDNLFLALFVVLVLFHPAFLWYFVFVMQCIVRVRIYYI